MRTSPCHVWLNLHETGDPFADDWMIVDGENPNRVLLVMTHPL
jgi:hypothetical protein